MLHSKDTIAIPPGETIREQLDSRSMTQKEFAKRMDMSQKHISHLINGKVELTPDVALRLESVLGLPAKFWSNLEMQFREKEARVKAELELEHDIEIARKFPYSKMATLGWVAVTRSIDEKVQNLRSFFRVARLGVLEELCLPGIAFRAVGSHGVSDYSLAAWAQQARLEALQVEVSPINVEKLKNSIPQIRAMTMKLPSDFCDDLREILAQCGIAIVFLPHIGGSFLHGATFVDGKYIVLGLTVRGRDADKFWFSLFHELCHVLEGHIFSIDKPEEEREKAADFYARDTLIRPDDYNHFVQTGDWHRSAITSFALEIGIDPGIVLGRLQKENHIPYNRYRELKTQYQILV